jgi:hypothetical protein
MLAHHQPPFRSFQGPPPGSFGLPPVHVGLSRASQAGLTDSPPTRFGAFRGPQTTIDTMRQLCLGSRGERSMLVRGAVEYCTRGLLNKDYLSEVLSIRNFVAERVRYQNDPVGLELVKDPQRLVEEMARYGIAVGDCDDMALLLATMARQLGREAEFITVGFGPPNHFSHVFARVKEPKTGKWIVLDPVAGTRETPMLARVTTWRPWKID